MSAEEFWNLYPVQFQARMERWEEKEHREFLRAGTIAAATYNVNRDPKKHPEAITAYDIFNIPRPPKPPLAPAQLKARAASFFDAYNAKVTRLEGRKPKKKAGGAPSLSR